MSKLVDSVINKDFVTADSVVSESFVAIMERKLLEAKKKTAAKMSLSEMKLDGFKPTDDNIEDRRPQTGTNQETKTDRQDAQIPTSGLKGHKEIDNPKTTTVMMKNNVQEEENINEARIKIIKTRIRNGKIQRRKKVSNVPGMTLRGGSLKRMSPAERRRRKLGAKRAVRKKAGKMGRILMKRQRSIRKRKAMGL